MGRTPYRALAPITRYAAKLERSESSAFFFFSVCDGGEAGEVEVHRQKVFHGFSKLYVEKMIEMTDADIVRAPFFKHHINEIIGNRVGMVVALVQLYLFSAYSCG